MKSKYALILAALLLNGCALYQDGNGNYASEAATRDCRQAASVAPGAPTRAEAFTPGGMDRAAVKLQELTDSCMARSGYRRG